MAKAKTPKTSGSAAKKPRSAVAPTAVVVAEPTPMRDAEPQQIRDLPADLHERIRARAYELWEQGGRRHDHAEEDWLRAEGEILGQHAARKTA